MRKEKGTSRQKKKAYSLFQQWLAELQHLNLPAASEANVAALRYHVGLNLSLVALVSFNSMPKYKSYEMDLSNYELKYWSWTNSQTLLKLYQMRTHIYQEAINIFLNTLTGGFNHLNCIQGKFPHPLNGCWTQEIKEKFLKSLCLSSVAVFFHIFLLGPSCSRSYINKTTWGKNRITSEWSQIKKQ